MTNKRYKLRVPLPATPLALLISTELIPSGEIVEVASECRNAGVLQLVWNHATYLTGLDSLYYSAERH